MTSASSTSPLSVQQLAAQSRVGRVRLAVHDLPRLEEFYRSVLGLDVVQRQPDAVTLGVGQRPLVQLESQPALPVAAASRPGLYHTAFLLPTRADLGRWLAHAAQIAPQWNLRLGTGDHLVSEAIYLSDPEGNGIEVYRDRPRDTWQWHGGQVQMDTRAVDVQGVLDAGGGVPASQAPQGTTIGHVHLKVGSAAQAAAFYARTLGLDVVADLGSAVFLSWGGYHHHVGLNEWHSRGQAAPTTPATGLAGVEFLTPDLAPLRQALADAPGVEHTPDSVSLTDPWGNRLSIREAQDSVATLLS